ncbi:sucrase ferredoxin [Candidatus Poriferisodalis sp.]|uniref:sucrase ferredoxin n=1 Tax=Candidatus Poriferisodalis sp. TaxID=3101277 RepID=UPI003B0272DC
MASVPDAAALTPAPPGSPAMPPLEADVLALLPAAEDAPRCSAHAAAIGTDPGGTAISADAVALVETPLPWPKPVFASGLLEGFTPVMELNAGLTRVLAVVPPHERGAHDKVPVVLHWRAGAGTRSAYFDADGPEGLRQLFAHLGDQSPADPVPNGAAFASVGYAENERAVLICTQGSHDVCCGSEGTRLAADFEAVLRAYRDADVNEPYAGAPTAGGRVAVYRVSHTGGHRFAPTAMTLPDGRMWAGIEAGEIATILDQTADATAMASRCRGWWGAPTGPAQVAERAVFAQVGWPLEHIARQVRFRPSGTGWDVDVVAAEAERAWRVSVEAGRTVPTIACRALGGLPAKPATEFTVTDIWETSK